MREVSPPGRRRSIPHRQCSGLLFAAIGRASHSEGLAIRDVASVAWPFLVALVLGWTLARPRGDWPNRLPGSPLVWLVTVVAGLTLRVLAGGGYAWTFGVVTLVVLGVFLIGWRCVVEIVRFTGEGLARWSDAVARRQARR
jgi:hypothetical protein